VNKTGKSKQTNNGYREKSEQNCIVDHLLSNLQAIKIKLSGAKTRKPQNSMQDPLASPANLLLLTSQKPWANQFFFKKKPCKQK
jgi:hypothetical protein